MHLGTSRILVPLLLLAATFIGAAEGQSLQQARLEAWTHEAISLGSAVRPSESGEAPTCARAGDFSVGDRVVLTVDTPDFASGLFAGQEGTVVAGSGGLLVEWDNWYSRHSGFCDDSSCGSCDEQGNSRWGEEV